MHRSCQRLHLWKQNHNHRQGEKKKKTFAFCEFSKTHHGKKRWEKRVREKNMQSDPHILIAHTEMVIWFFELILTHELHFYLPSK